MDDRQIPASKYLPTAEWHARKASGDWAQDWPEEMSDEYRDAASVKDRAPDFTALGKGHMLAVRVTFFYSLVIALLVLGIKLGWIN